MARVSSNTVGLSHAKEITPGTAGVVWARDEPNSFTDVGAEISTVARSPIARDRQRRKGTITDLDSSFGYEADLTNELAHEFLGAYIGAVGTQEDLTLRPSAVAATGGYTIPAVTAEQRGKLVQGANFESLFVADGFGVSSNNGLFGIGAVPAAAATAIVLNGLTGQAAHVAETTPPHGARIRYAGVRLHKAQSKTRATAGSRVTITTTSGPDWSAVGLTEGQVIGIVVHETTATDTQSDPLTSNGRTVIHYGRVRSTTATTLVLDKTSAALRAYTIPASSVVDVLFGSFYRNIPVGDSGYEFPRYTFEIEMPNLSQTAGRPMFQYVRGAGPGTLALNIPITDKATASLGFVALDTDPYVEESARLAGASTPLPATLGAAVNTTADIGRIRVQELDEDGLTTDIESLTINLNNNVEPEKVLGKLGARYVNQGTFEVDLDMRAIFSDARVSSAVRNNRTVSFDCILSNHEGAIAVDIPEMTLGGANPEIEDNRSVLVGLTGTAHRSAELGYSASISLVPWTHEDENQ